MRRTTLAVIGLGVAALAGCQPHSLRVPADFVPVDREGWDPYDVRAVSADGCAVGLKSEPNPKKATLEFWSEAVTNELTEGQGYRLVGKAEPVTSETGVAGRLLTFTIETSGVPFTYLVALFVQPDVILIAQAGGKTEALKPKLDAIRKALLSAK